MPTTLGHKLVPLDNTGAETVATEYQAIYGVCPGRRRRTEVLVRPGVDDVTIRDLGTKAEPFQIITREYKVSIASARSAVKAYELLIGSGMQYGVRVYQQGVNQGDFAVLDVQQYGAILPIGAAVNSLLANPAAMLNMQWTLIELDLTP